MMHGAGIAGNDIGYLAATTTASATAAHCNAFDTCVAFQWSYAGTGWLKTVKGPTQPMIGSCFYVKGVHTLQHTSTSSLR